MQNIPTVAYNHFEVQGNTLTASVDLLWEYHSEFRDCCNALIQSEAEEIVIDLSSSGFIFSTYIGTIGSIIFLATENGKQLTIRVSRELSWLFEATGIPRIVKLEIAN